MMRGEFENPGHNPGVSTPQNPGVSTPQSPFPLEECCISGEHFRDHALSIDVPDENALAASHYSAWIDSLKGHLSPTGQLVIASWWSFDLLSDVYNCGAAHTKLFGAEVDHTRREHCIHAAYVSRQVCERALITLTDYERTVLELVMLLHDPHRLGSHALDRVIASLPGAPPIHKWGWDHDFHEYHGAQQVYHDSDIKKILGEHWQDVLSVLSFPDTRSPTDPSRIEDFGPSPYNTPTEGQQPLARDRIRLLYQLKNEIDRMSYLELDFRRSGFDPKLVRGLLACIQTYQEHMVTVGSNLAVILPDRKSGASSLMKSYPFDPWIGARQLHREHIATHPTSCLVDALLQEALGTNLQTSLARNLPPHESYKTVRDVAIEGSYQKLFGRSVIEILRAPHSDHSTLGLEDLYAPLVTLSRDDFLAKRRSPYILDHVAPEKSVEICGFPRTDMTQLEYHLRMHLRERGLDSKIFVVLSNDFEKILEFKCVESPKVPRKNNFLTNLMGSSDNDLSPELRDVVRFAVRSSAQSEKFIVTMPALDEESGACRDLRPIQEAVQEFFRSRKILKDPAALVTKYNHRAFCDPLSSQIFRPEVQQRMADFQPEWVKMGGCGLVFGS